MDLQDLWVSIKTKMDQGSVNRAKKELKELEAQGKAVEKVFDRFKDVAKGALMGFLGFEGIKKGFEAIRQSAERGADIDKLALQLGLTADEVQRLNYVAGQTDTSMESVKSAFGSLAALMAQADKGSAKALKTMEQWDVAFKDPSGKWRPMLDILRDVSDETANLTAEERLGRLQSLFGGAGADLIPMLSEGSKGISKLMGMARVKTEEQIKLDKELEDGQKDKADAYRHLFDLFAGEGTSAVVRFDQAQTKLADSPGAQKLAKLFGGVFGGIATGAEVAVDHVTKLLNPKQDSGAIETSLLWIERTLIVMTGLAVASKIASAGFALMGRAGTGVAAKGLEALGSVFAKQIKGHIPGIAKGAAEGAGGVLAKWAVESGIKGFFQRTTVAVVGNIKTWKAAFLDFGGNATKLTGVLKSVVIGIKDAAVGFYRLAAAVVAATWEIALIAAALVGTALVLEDIYYFLTGGESLLKDFLSEVLPKDHWAYTLQMLLTSIVDKLKYVRGEGPESAEIQKKLAESRNAPGGVMDEAIWDIAFPILPFLNYVLPPIKDLLGSTADIFMSPVATPAQMAIPGQMSNNSISAPVTINVTTTETDGGVLGNMIGKKVTEAWQGLFQTQLSNANGPVSDYGFNTGYGATR